jgi:hypothetical protein
MNIAPLYCLKETDPLYACQAKVETAQEHLLKLHADAIAAQHDGSYGPRVELNSDTGEHVVRFDFPESLRVKWGIAAGVIVYLLRSALDNAIWQLVEANWNTPSRGNEFPIFIDAAEHQRSMKRRGYLKGVHPEVVALINRVQPYMSGDRATKNVLWIIHELCIRDKHRTVNLAALSYRYQLLFTGTGPEVQEVHEFPGGQWDQHGAELHRLHTVPGATQVEMQGEFTADIVFSEVGPAYGQPFIPLLEVLCRWIYVLIYDLNICCWGPRGPE